MAHQRDRMDPLVVAAGEKRTDELLDALDEGRRVVVTTTFLGSEKEVTLRREGDVFYCDTPTTLHKHDSREGMRTCIENQGYAEQ